MSVDRRVVEVRPELVDRVLAVLADVELPAETDDRLLRGAVSVVGVAAPIELDQPDVVLLGPEDVVREEAIAVVRGQFGHLRRTDIGVPDERRNAIKRPRSRGEALQRRADLALPVDALFVPELAQQVIVLDS